MHSYRPRILSTQPYTGEYPHNLLLTCRQIYNELIPIVYSQRFLISYSETNGLDGLQNISPYGLQHMRDLTVVLSREQCVHKVKPQNTSPLFGREPNTYSYTRPLLLKSPRKRPTAKILKDWRRALERLAASITPGRLHLQLICHVGNFSTAEAMLAPLAKLPVLNECSISLGRLRTNGLAELARISRLQAKGMLPRNVTNVRNPTPFRYEDLPLEIRLIVLEYTDLVPMGGEICWDTEQGYYLKGPDICWAHHPATIPVCFYCTSYQASAVGERCVCWKPPVALWHVSRAFREEALRVFFHNRFIIINDMSTIYRISWMSPQSSFLSWPVPSGALKYIRSLEVILKGHKNSFYVDHSQNQYPHENLTDALERTKRDWNPLGLTLSVYLPMTHFYRGRHLTEFASEKNLLPENTYNYYRGFFTALSKFRNLNRLFVYALQPNSNDRYLDRWQVMFPSSGGEKWRHMEKSLEQLTMGPQYDSNDVGKWPSPDGRHWEEDSEED